MCVSSNTNVANVLHPTTNQRSRIFLVNYMKIEDYVIGYKIYSLFIAIFEFMRINSMYTLTNVVCCEKLNPTNLGLALAHLFGSP